MGWRCQQCQVVNHDDHHWCPTCGPDVRSPIVAAPVIRVDLACPGCLTEIDPGQIYDLATGRHIGCSVARSAISIGRRRR